MTASEAFFATLRCRLMLADLQAVALRLPNRLAIDPHNPRRLLAGRGDRVVAEGEPAVLEMVAKVVEYGPRLEAIFRKLELDVLGGTVPSENGDAARREPGGIENQHLDRDEVRDEV